MGDTTSQVGKQAFTLIELVVVISIIGILAAVAIPRFIDIRSEAYTAQRDGTVGAVRAGIMLVASKNQAATSPQSATFPPDLEATWGSITGGTLEATATACSASAPCFELVLSQPVTAGEWEQTTSTTYTFTPPVGSAKTYTYTQATGRFD